LSIFEFHVVFLKYQTSFCNEGLRQEYIFLTVGGQSEKTGFQYGEPVTWDNARENGREIWQPFALAVCLIC
jgi:hypothetical protein